jgi:hypothetical protein
VTITHPCHPLLGQRVEIVRIRRGNDPDLIIREPEGQHRAIAASWTDYAGGESQEVSPVVPLLDLEGLRQIAQLMVQYRQAGRLPETVQPGREER